MLTISLVGTLYQCYSSWTLIKGLEITCNEVLIRRKLNYHRSQSINILTADAFNDQLHYNAKERSDRKWAITERNKFTPTGSPIADSIEYYRLQSKIEDEFFFSMYPHSCFWGMNEEQIYQAYDSDNLYLGIPLNYYSEQMSKYDIYINGKMVNPTLSGRYMVPKAESYTIDLDLVQINLYSGLLDTLSITKVVTPGVSDE